MSNADVPPKRRKGGEGCPATSEAFSLSADAGKKPSFQHRLQSDFRQYPSPYVARFLLSSLTGGLLFWLFFYYLQIPSPGLFALAASPISGFLAVVLLYNEYEEARRRLRYRADRERKWEAAVSRIFHDTGFVIGHFFSGWKPLLHTYLFAALIALAVTMFQDIHLLVTHGVVASADVRRWLATGDYRDIRPITAQPLAVLAAVSYFLFRFLSGKNAGPSLESELDRRVQESLREDRKGLVYNWVRRERAEIVARYSPEQLSYWDVSALSPSAKERLRADHPQILEDLKNQEAAREAEMALLYRNRVA